MARRRRIVAGVVRTLLALAVGAVLFWVGSNNLSDLGKVHLRLDPLWLLASIPVYGVGSLFLAIGWRAQLDAFGHRLPLGTAIRVWWRAQLARYVPTGVAAFASRAALARQEGVPASLGAASLAVELVTLIGWGSLVAAVGLPSSLLSTPLRIVLGVGAAAGLGLLPYIYRAAAKVGGRVPVLNALAELNADHAKLYLSELLYGVSIVVKSTAFVLFATALVSTRGSDTWLLGGSVQGASVIGLIGITPAGIGVRETAMVGMLSHRFDATDAAAIAVAWRCFEFAFELTWLGIGTIWRRREEPAGTLTGA